MKAELYLKQIIAGTEWENLVFIAGGYVRDEIMGLVPKDIDLVIDRPNGGIDFANWITKTLGTYKEDSNPVVYPRFGTAKFVIEVDGEKLDIESVMPRSEEYTEGSRKPDVQMATMLDDAKRRDLTINSLFKNISTGEVLDLLGTGKDHIEKGIIQTPIEPIKTFTDDPLRMLRAIRFKVKYGFDFSHDLMWAFPKTCHKIKDISNERIQDELNKILVSDNVDIGLRWLTRSGLLHHIIPEFIKTINMMQNEYHIDSVWYHTIDVVKNTKPILLNRLIALFHDIGKGVTKTEDETGIHFYKHELEGSIMTREILGRLKYPNDIIDKVCFGVHEHMRLKQAGEDGNHISNKALRKFVHEMGDMLEPMLDVMHADNLSHAPEHCMPNQIPGIRKRIEELQDIKEKVILPINGNDLIQMGIKPGPIFKEILDRILDKYYEDPNITRKEAIEIAEIIYESRNNRQ